MEKISNLLEYAGVRSSSYYHASTPPTYDPENPLAYYVEESPRAYYNGPFDDIGLPLYRYEGRLHHLPVFLCFWGLGHLDIYRRDRNEEALAKFLNVARWLAQEQNDDGVWLSETPMPKFGLIDPFPSAMNQGLAISCLCRAYLVTNEAEFLQKAVLALDSFHKEVREGGVTSFHGELCFYEEYPAHPGHHVLNGFLYAMWGLYDLIRQNNEDARKLYDEGIKTLLAWLPRYDIGYWSLYHISDSMKNPASIHYHRLHIDQLKVMHALTGNDLIGEYQKRWQGYVGKRFNALRTLPSKLAWRFFYKPRS